MNKILTREMNEYGAKINEMNKRQDSPNSKRKA